MANNPNQKLAIRNKRTKQVEHYEIAYSDFVHDLEAVIAADFALGIEYVTEDEYRLERARRVGSGQSEQVAAKTRRKRK